MKKSIFCLLMGAMIVSLTSCEKKELETVIAGQETPFVSPTAKYFPEPSFKWGVSKSELNQIMTDLGWKYDEKESDEKYTIYKYLGIRMDCIFYPNYQGLYSNSLNFSEAQELIANYSKDSRFTKRREGVIYTEVSSTTGEKYEEYGALFASKDEKTIVVFFWDQDENWAEFAYACADSEFGEDLLEEIYYE